MSDKIESLGYEHLRDAFEDCAQRMGLSIDRRPDRRRVIYASNATKLAWAIWKRAYATYSIPATMAPMPWPPDNPPKWTDTKCMFCEFTDPTPLGMQDHLNKTHNPPPVMR